MDPIKKAARMAGLFDLVFMGLSLEINKLVARSRIKGRM